jgi:enoyl-CoA hydratase
MNILAFTGDIMQTHVTFEHKGDIGYLTFACETPGKPTTLDLHVLNELDACLDEVETLTATLRAIIVQSAFPKYFLVGANINALQTLNAETIVPWVQGGHAVFNRLARLPLPVIAKVEGYALGGGLELVMACDLIAATESARFGQPEANLGVVAGWGGSYRLPRRVGLAKAKELFFTGRIVDAATAHDIGLADFVGDVNAYLDALLADIRKCGRVAVASMKRLIDNSPGITIEQNCLDEAVASSRCMADADTQARVANYLEGRKSK